MKFQHVTLALLFTAVTHSYAGTSQDDLSDDLRAVSKELNKSLPVQIDRDKILEVTLAVQSTLIFKYKFIDETVINHPNFRASKYIAQLRISLGESTCKDSGSLELLQRGAKYNYLFTTRSGLRIIDFTLDSSGCAEYLASTDGPKSPKQKAFDLVCSDESGFSATYSIDEASQTVRVNGVARGRARVARRE